MRLTDADFEPLVVRLNRLAVGRNRVDPFDDSSMAVEAYMNGDWVPLLKHNLADVRRTHELAVLAERYVPKKDFRMKNLEPPSTTER